MAKKHHYVPATYLRQFTDDSGQLWVYRKDDPAKPFRQRPEATGFERYYYSQVADDGTRDDDRMEALFSEVESHWPSIAAALKAREPIFPSAPQIITFLALMRVRGPACRDMVELLLAHQVHTQAQVMKDNGQLPPLPVGHEDLWDKLQIAIDPHRSLMAMPHLLQEIGGIAEKLHYDVLHNETDTDFITSDNPVIYFDPTVPTVRRLPYTVRPAGRIELLLPVSPRMLLRGRTQPFRQDIGHRAVKEARLVRQRNRLIARFAYRTIFATRLGHEKLIADNAGTSPVPRFDRVPAPRGGYFDFRQMVFGPRPVKPKW